LKLKALQSYQEAKFKRLKHIKSKRYRKILKKERQKEEEKNMSVMEKEDPIKFKEVLENLQKQRIKERMSLKHKNTSKWAKKLQVYAKYDEKARDQIQEQLDLSKKLTTKLKQFEYNDSDDEDTEAKSSSIKAENRDQKVAVSAVIDTLKPKMADNPWLRMMSGVGGTDGKDAENGKDGEEEEWGLKKLQTIRNPEAQVEEEKEVSDKPVETTDKSINDEKVDDVQEKKADETVEKVQMSSEVKINVKRQSDDQAHRLTLMEAFADDDIVEEFKTDKV
jgi:U3 small nucleolar RNA-associated protein 14